jgi:alcohol dehydrogenase
VSNTPDFFLNFKNMKGLYTLPGKPEIVFGAGTFTLLPGLIKPYGTNALVVMGSRSFQDSKYREMLQEGLLLNGIRFIITQISHEPTPQMIDKVTDLYRNEDIEVVVAIGGGSVLDAGKAISAMLPREDSVIRYLEDVGEKVHDGQKVPFIAVPTTSGTGSEATKNAVICQHGEKGFKKSLRHDRFIPEVALVDPELTVSCPQLLTAQCGLDAFSQLLEGFTSTQATLVTDSLALPALVCAGRSLVHACNDGGDIKARTDMAYASLVSGIVLANAGLGLIHGLASAIGGLYDIPHGVICGTLLGVINRLNINKLISQDRESVYLIKYAETGRIFCGEVNRSTEYYALYLADKLDELVESLHIPKLGTIGAADPDMEKIISLSGHKNNPVKLTDEEIITALSQRI